MEEVEDFARFLASVPIDQKVVIAGNHDWPFEQEELRMGAIAALEEAGAIYLDDSGCNLDRIRIWGSPVQPWFFDWAFNGYPEQLKQKWALIPPKTDILVVHGPPHGYGDGVPEGDAVRLAGCPHLLERIRDIEPRLVVFGHIHEGRGQWQIGRTTLANVTLLDAAYDMLYKPWVFELASSRRDAAR